MNIDQLLGKILGGEITKEELSMLKEWKNEAKDNLEALEEMKKIAALSEEMPSYTQYNVEEALHRVENRVGEKTMIEENTAQNKPTSPKVSNLKWMSMAMKVAAAMVIVLSAIFVMRNGIGNIPSLPKEYVTTQSQEQIPLSDGTQLVMDIKTKVNVLSPRKVSLRGRAFFEVAKDKDHPFEVILPIGKVVVLGTRFSIHALPDQTQLYVEEGHVRYELGNRRVDLIKGDYISVINGDITKVKNNNPNILSWKEQKIVFDDEMLSNVLNIVSAHFQKEIKVEEGIDLSKCRVTSSFTHPKLEDILNEFSKTHGIKYEIRDGIIYVVNVEC